MTKTKSLTPLCLTAHDVMHLLMNADRERAAFKHFSTLMDKKSSLSKFFCLSSFELSVHKKEKKHTTQTH